MTTEADGLFKVYEDYSKTLRTWLVSYGIGAPVLLLTNDKVVVKILAGGNARDIAILYLLGVGLQVFLAFINKSVAWICYYAKVEDGTKSPDHWYYVLARWIIRQFWIDIAIDVVSFAFFALATWWAFKAVLS